MNESNEKKHKSVVYVYRGTFDPFHLNHEMICRWCLTQSHTKQLVIHINYRPSSACDIKHPAPWAARFNIIKAVFQEQAEIRPQESFYETLEWVKNTYGDGVEVVEVFGSDVLGQISDKPLISAFAHHVRTLIDTSHTVAELHHKPLIAIPLDLPPISSTKVRVLLMKGMLKDVSSMLSVNALDYIRASEDYSPLSISIRELRIKKLVISSDVVQKLMTNFKTRIYLQDKTQQYHGLSGDTIIEVNKNNKTVALCKLFHLGDKACKMEVENHRWIANFARVPLIYFSCDNMVCMKYVEGNTPRTVDDFIRIGKAYSDFHTKGLQQLNKRCEPFEAIDLQQKIDMLCHSVSDDALANRIMQVFDKLFTSYIGSAHKKSTIHGDAQPGNVLLIANQVTFIDFGKVKKKQDPTRDVNQMVSSIYWKAYQKNEISEDDVLIIKENIDAFLKGYSYQTITAADSLWNFYWSVKSVLLALNKPQLPLSRHILSEFNKTLSIYESSSLHEEKLTTNLFFKASSSRLENIGSECEQAARLT